MTDRQDYGPPWQPQYDPRQHQQRVQGQHRVQYPPQGYGQVQPYAPPPYQGYAPPQSRYQGYAPPSLYQGCPPYGQPQYALQYAPQVAPKSTAAGLILGLLWPGVGCMYAGRIGIGILIMAIWLISIPLMFVGIGFVTGFCAWVASAALGYGLTREWNAKRGIVS